MNKFLLCLLPFAMPSFAATIDCPAATIQHIQVQKTVILYKLTGYNWHRLGEPSDPGVQAMYSAMLAAQMSGKRITVRYPEGYDCKAYELGTAAGMVRTHN